MSSYQVPLSPGDFANLFIFWLFGFLWISTEELLLLVSLTREANNHIFSMNVMLDSPSLLSHHDLKHYALDRGSRETLQSFHGTDVYSVGFYSYF